MSLYVWTKLCGILSHNPYPARQSGGSEGISERSSQYLLCVHGPGLVHSMVQRRCSWARGGLLFLDGSAIPCCSIFASFTKSKTSSRHFIKSLSQMKHFWSSGWWLFQALGEAFWFIGGPKIKAVWSAARPRSQSFPEGISCTCVCVHSIPTKQDLV